MLNKIFKLLRDYSSKNCFKASIPIISVGNITLGGSGKTPLVYFLAENLSKYYKVIAILTRGYGKILSSSAGAKLGLQDDEDLTYRMNGNIVRIVNKDRVKGVKKAIDKGAELAIMDDGFQYKKLQKNMEILVINPFQKIFSSFIFPLGILREGIDSISYSDIIVISNSNFLEEKKKQFLLGKLQKYNKPIYQMNYKILYLVNTKTGEKLTTEQFRRKNVIIFSGIGFSQGFELLLKHHRINTIRIYKFSDHHKYTKKELNQITSDNYYPLITTEKDFLRLNEEFINKTNNLFYTVLDVEIDEKFLQTVKALLQKNHLNSPRC